MTRNFPKTCGIKGRLERLRNQMVNLETPELRRIRQVESTAVYALHEEKLCLLKASKIVIIPQGSILGPLYSFYSI
jgi:hypothetical protein